MAEKKGKKKEASSEGRNLLDGLSGRQKVAILLIALGQENSVDLMKNLEEEEIESITLEIANLRIVDQQLQEAVMEEFHSLLMAGVYLRQGGFNYALSLLSEAFGEETAQTYLDRFKSFVDAPPFDFLRNTDTTQLQQFLQNEHPQTTALILSYLSDMDSNKVAKILSSLTPEQQVDVGRRIAYMERTNPDMVREVERVVEAKLGTVISSKFSQVGGERDLIEAVTRMERSIQKAFLENLEQEDPDLYEKVIRGLFQFEDLRKLDDRSVQIVMKEVQTKDLGMALRGVSEEVKSKILNNMSQRAAQMLEEDMESAGPVRARDVEEAQQRIIQIIRTLEAKGAIIISHGSEDALL